MNLSVKKSSGLCASDRVFYLLVYAIAGLAFVITLYPFLYILAVSFSGTQAVYQGKVFLFPVDFTLSGYQQVFKQQNLWTAYGNTIYYTVAGTFLNILVTTIAAYPLARRHFFARRFFNFFIAFTMYFSGGMIPSYLLITRLGLYLSLIHIFAPACLLRGRLDAGRADDPQSADRLRLPAGTRNAAHVPFLQPVF